MIIKMKLLFLLLVILLSSYVASQMVTEKVDTTFNLSYILDGFNKSKTQDLDISEKNKWCQQRFECRPRDNFFYYDCYFDENISNCRCLVGMFSRCNLEASNLSIMATPVRKPFMSMQYIKQTLNSTLPMLRSARKILFDLRTVAVGVLILLILIIVIYAHNRDTSSNNLRKARNYHRKAQMLYEKGNYLQAEKYYKLADDHRKRVKEF